MHSHTKISPRFLPPRSPCTHYPHLEMPLVYCYTHSSAVEFSLSPNKCIHEAHKLAICHRSHEPKIETDGEHNTVHVKKKKLYVTACFFIFLILSSNATKMYEGH